MDNNEIRIGIADFNIALSPGILVTVGLGSCIGITLFDKIHCIGGLAHIMLPDSTQFNNVTNPLKFADLAIPILIDKMISMGATKSALKAKIAGGASMFNFSDKSMTMDIGNRNSLSVKATLNKFCIPLISEDVGGNKGRTILLNTTSGMVVIKTVGLELKEI